MSDAGRSTIVPADPPSEVVASADGSGAKPATVDAKPAAETGPAIAAQPKALTLLGEAYLDSGNNA